MTDEIDGVYRGRMIALPQEQWAVFQTMKQTTLAIILRRWADCIHLEKYRKATCDLRSHVRNVSMRSFAMCPPKNHSTVNGQGKYGNEID